MQMVSLAWIGWVAWEARPWPSALIAAFTVSGAWLLWASRALGDSLTPDPKPNARGLKTGGPYRWIRHPMYLGLLVPSVCTAIADARAWFGVVPLAASLVAKVVLEERLLRLVYPEFEEYARHSWRLLPYVW